MKLSAILEPLIAAGVSGNVILATVRAFEAEQETTVDQGKEKARERWRRWKAKQPETNVGKRLQTDTNVSKRLVRGDARVEDNLLPKKISGQEEKISFDQEFEKHFWPAYPRKAGKGSARKAFVAARKSGVSLDALVSGAQRYAAERAGEDPKYTKHAAAWLHAESWDDEPIPKHVQPRATAPPEQQTMSDVLDRIQGKSNVPHQGPTIDASVNRADRGSAQNLVRLDAFAARNRP